MEIAKTNFAFVGPRKAKKRNLRAECIRLEILLIKHELCNWKWWTSEKILKTKTWHRDSWNLTLFLLRILNFSLNGINVLTVQQWSFDWCEDWRRKIYWRSMTSRNFFEAKNRERWQNLFYCNSPKLLQLLSQRNDSPPKKNCRNIELPQHKAIRWLAKCVHQVESTPHPIDSPRWASSTNSRARKNILSKLILINYSW